MCAPRPACVRRLVKDSVVTQASSKRAAPSDLIELGRIVSAYGVKGWVKVQPYSSQAEVLLAASTWWLARTPAPGAVASKAATADAVARDASSSDVCATSADAGRAGAAVADCEAVTVLTSRPQGSTVVAALDGVDDRDVAHAMRGIGVYISRADFPAVEAGEYYWVDLVGCLVYGDDDGASVLLGRVADVTENGAHALLKVQRLVQEDAGLRPLLSAKGREQELLVPFVDAHLLSVDLAARRIDTNWPIDYE